MLKARLVPYLRYLDYRTQLGWLTSAFRNRPKIGSDGEFLLR